MVGVVQRQHLNIRVYGRVQGVFYRAFVQEQAETFDITGFAENQSDGSVYIEAEGNESALRDFVHKCRRGSRGAQVDDIEIEKGALKQFSAFEIR